MAQQLRALSTALAENPSFIFIPSIHMVAHNILQFQIQGI